MEQSQVVVKTELWHGRIGSIFQKLINEGQKISCSGSRKKGFVLARREVTNDRLLLS